MNGRLISYLRVSTDKQGKSGLGLEAQREAVAGYLNGGDWKLVNEYVEVESGKHDDRPELTKALARCTMTGATLIVAKLDRLSRNQSFLMSIYEGTGEGGVVFCDLPTIPAGPVWKFIVQQMAAVAELERGLISQRTKVALAAAKVRGRRLGGYRGGPVVDQRLATEARRLAADRFASSVGPTISEMRASGLSLGQIAERLAADGIKTARGGQWTPTAVLNVLNRLTVTDHHGAAVGDTGDRGVAASKVMGRRVYHLAPTSLQR
jgi:DNA invertase Pin-like site-specific DNA recombinase